MLGRGDKNTYNFSYFFFDRQSSVFSDNIQQQVQNLFDNHRSVTESVNGQAYDQVQYLQKHAHHEYGIPVFALMMQGKVHSFGFANMPRVSYKHSSRDLVDNLAKEHNEDSYFSLTDLMFGTLREDALGLKSRVMFSDAVLTSKEGSIISKSVVLSSPKPSFLGAYIEQPDAEQYASYGYHNEKETAKLAGWKRYPVKREFTENEPPNDNSNVQTKLEMLTENHEFSGRIVFHNLKCDELGGLIWVLTLNGSHEHYHTLGHAKSLGAGAVQFELSLDENTLYSNNGQPVDCNPLSWVERFVAHMDSQMVKGEWLKTPQIKHLLALADGYISDENDFSTHGLSEFQRIKNDKSSIEPLSYNGSILSRTDNAPERLGSLAFGKGRLSRLVDIESNVLHQTFAELSQSKQDIMEKKQKKQALAQAAEALQDAPPYERSLGLLQNIVEEQDGSTASFKKDKAKEIRTIAKDLKEAILTSEEVGTLLAVVKQISIAEKDIQN
uniref:TIGR03986 family type III CRISPR-associated RAMP protein n=1 Tax=Vibrio alfacsensis TaxID=1074311 RepID=UPI001F497D71|nr:TIGR03986 family CRISPR-associated RAMP protein [Vibrio alfacsensis]